MAVSSLASHRTEAARIQDEEDDDDRFDATRLGNPTVTSLVPVGGDRNRHGWAPGDRPNAARSGVGWE